MTPTIRLLLAGLALLLVGTLAGAALWSTTPGAPQTVVADAVAPASSGIFPKVLNR